MLPNVPHPDPELHREAHGKCGTVLAVGYQVKTDDGRVGTITVIALNGKIVVDFGREVHQIVDADTVQRTGYVPS